MQEVFTNSPQHRKKEILVDFQNSTSYQIQPTLCITDKSDQLSLPWDAGSQELHLVRCRGEPKILWEVRGLEGDPLVPSVLLAVHDMALTEQR